MKYTIDIFPYPFTTVVEAKTEAEAKEKAKAIYYETETGGIYSTEVYSKE